MGWTNVWDDTRLGRDGSINKTWIFETKLRMEVYGQVGGVGGTSEDMANEWID